MSKLFSWRWPTAEGEVTAIDIETLTPNREAQNLRLAVGYKFSLGGDGPYTGENFWKPSFSRNIRVVAARDSLRVGQPVIVRYRPDDPSVSTLDRRVWKDL